MITFLDQHGPALAVASPLLAAFALPLVARLGSAARDGLAVIMSLLSAAILLHVASLPLTGDVVVYAFGATSPTVGAPIDSGGIPIRILFAIDALSALMLIAAAIISVCAVIFALAQERGRSGQTPTLSLLFLLLAGAVGMVSTGDVFNLFVFLEIASLAGAGLVAVRLDKGVAVEAGLKYAIISTVGGLMFLAGIALLYGQYGSLNIALLAQRVTGSPLDQLAMLLMAVPMAGKCGAVPMHMWKPDAYDRAPAAATAILIVSSQASLYVLFRLAFTLFGNAIDTAFVGQIMIVLGLLSMFIGVTMALPQKQVKRLIGYHSVSQVGYMLTAVGVGLAVMGDDTAMASYGKAAIAGGLFHLINYIIYKSLLFLIAGNVIHRTGERNLNNMGGLGHVMQISSACFLVASMAIAGLPPLNGFASKLMIYESVFAYHPLIAIVAIVTSVLTLASFLKVFHSMFMGPMRKRFASVREVPWAMLGPVVALTVLVVVVGLFPSVFVDRMIVPAAEALVDRADYIMAVMGGK